MKHTRWYDKDPDIKILLETFQSLSDEAKLDVSIDIIQVIIEYNKHHSDEYIHKFAQNYSPDRKRWYDADENIHSAVEMLKLLPKEHKEEILKEFLYTIIHYKKKEL